MEDCQDRWFGLVCSFVVSLTTYITLFVFGQGRSFEAWRRRLRGGLRPSLDGNSVYHGW